MLVAVLLITENVVCFRYQTVWRQSDILVRKIEKPDLS